MKPKVGVLLAVALCLCVTGCKKDLHQSALKHAAKAEEILKEGDDKAALIEVRAALKDDPECARAHYVGGVIDVRTGFFSSAYREFSWVIKRDPAMLDARIAVADLLLETGNYTETREQVDAILSNAKWETNTHAKLIKAELEIAQKNVDAGSKIIDEVIAAEPKNSRALLDRAFLRSVGGDYKGAHEDLAAVHQSAPNLLGPVVAMSNLFEKEGKLDNSEQVLREAIKADDSAANNYALGVALAKHGKIPEAEQSFRRVKELAGKNKRLRMVLPQFYLALGRVQDAENEYRSIVNEDPTDSMSAQSLARLYIAQSRLQDAQSILDTLIKASPQDAQSILMRGQIEAAEGKTDQAAVDLQLARKLNPSSSAANIALARVMLQAGQMDRARASLEEILAKWPDNVEAHLMLGQLQLNDGNFDGAQRNAEQVIASGGAKLDAGLLLAQVNAARGQMDAAGKDLETLLALGPPPAQRLMIQENLGWIRIKQGQYSEAQKLARDMLKTQSNSTAGILVLASADVAQGRSSVAIAELSEWGKKYPSPSVYVELGNLQLHSNAPEAAQASFKKALSLNPGLTIATLGLAEAYGAAKNLKEAIAIYKQLLAASPTNSRYLYRLATAYEADGDWKNAQAIYEKALGYQADNALIQNNLAWLYAKHDGNLDVALKLAQSAVSLAPKQPHFSDTLGWIYVKKGAYDAAVQQFSTALAIQPQNPEYRYHLALALSKLGKNDRARQELAAALRVPSFGSRQDAQQLYNDLSR